MTQGGRLYIEQVFNYLLHFLANVSAPSSGQGATALNAPLIMMFQDGSENTSPVSVTWNNHVATFPESSNPALLTFSIGGAQQVHSMDASGASHTRSHQQGYGEDYDEGIDLCLPLEHTVPLDSFSSLITQAVQQQAVGDFSNPLPLTFMGVRMEELLTTLQREPMRNQHCRQINFPFFLYFNPVSIFHLSGMFSLFQTIRFNQETQAFTIQDAEDDKEPSGITTTLQLGSSGAITGITIAQDGKPILEFLSQLPVNDPAQTIQDNYVPLPPIPGTGSLEVESTSDSGSESESEQPETTTDLPEQQIPTPNAVPALTHRILFIMIYTVLYAAYKMTFEFN